MQCLYCDQRLNIFKSVGGWSFCSPEHQKLYQEKESHTAFERLLEFAKNDSEPTAGPAQTEPELQTVAEPDEQADEAAELAPEPAAVGFLAEPMVSPALSASFGTNAGPEIPESGFTPDLPTLPSLSIEIAVTDLETASPLLGAGPVDQPPPYPRASWSHFSLAGIDAPEARSEVATVGPLRPRATVVDTPTDARLSGVGLPSLLFSSDIRRLQRAIDTGELVDLARLEPVHREAQTVNAKARWSSPKPRMPAVGLNLVPQAKLSGDASDASSAVGMVGAVSRARVGSNVSPAVPRPPAATLTRPILAGVQNAPGPGQPAIAPARLEQRECQAPAMHWRAPEAGLAGLPWRAPANLKLDPNEGSTAVPMNRALARAGLAAAVRRPQAPSSRNVSTLGSSGILNRVFPAVQNATDPPVYTTGSGWLAQRECVKPADSIAPALAAVKGPVATPGDLKIRESDTVGAVGITDVTKPPAPADPLCILDAPAARCSVTLVINRVARKILAQVQDHEGFESVLLSPVLPARRECLLPAIFWSSHTWLRSAIASVGRLHESDCAFQDFPAEPPATDPFSIRFAREWFRLDVPAIAFNRTPRQLTREVCEWNAEVAGLEGVRSSATSALSLVALPEVFVKRLAVRFIGNLNQFTSITNSPNRGVVPSAAASGDQHKPAMALPRSPGLGPSPGFHLSSPAAVKSPPIEPTDIKFAGSSLLPPPSPVRVQPASMLVLPWVNVGRVQGAHKDGTYYAENTLEGRWNSLP